MPSHHDVDELWAELEGHLERASPRCFATLAPPAPPEALAALAQHFGELPPDLVASLERHDGQRDPSELHTFSGAGLLLGVDGILNHWQLCESVALEAGAPPLDEDYVISPSDLVQSRWGGRGPDPAPPEPWWKPTLLPFVASDADSLCLDLDPDLERGRGEVVFHVHDAGIERGIATSFSAWFAELLNRVRQGGIKVDSHGFMHLEPPF